MTTIIFAIYLSLSGKTSGILMKPYPSLSACLEEKDRLQAGNKKDLYFCSVYTTHNQTNGGKK